MVKTRQRFLKTAIACMASCLVPRSALAQCAMCNTAATGNDVGRGLSISVLFLLGTLGILVLCFAALVVLRTRVCDERPAMRPEAVDRPA